jgi:hypothetical protein
MFHFYFLVFEKDLVVIHDLLNVMLIVIVQVRGDVIDLLKMVDKL